jgi:hypothetical protein
MGPRGFRLLGRDLLHDAATALHLSLPALWQDLQGGKTLATMAGQQGSTLSALEASLVQDLTAQINGAVTTGILTGSEGTRMEAHLPAMVARFATMKLPAPGFGGRPRRWGCGQAMLQDAAQALNVPTATVKQDLQGGKSLAAIAVQQGSSATALEAVLVKDLTANVQQRVQAGTLTSAQATRIEARLPNMVAHWVTGTPRSSRPHRRAMGLLGPRRLLDDAASALHLTVPALRSDLAGGQTLASVAAAHASSAALLEASLVQDVKTSLGQAVTAGHLTEAQEARIVAHLPQWIDWLVTAARMPPAGGHPGLGRRGHML